MMKKLNFLYPLAVLLGFFLMQCNRQASDAKPKRIKTGATIDIGAWLPEIGTTRNDTVNIILAPSAQYFFIDLNLQQSAKNIELIKSARQKGIPVRAKVFRDQPQEIAEIGEASKADLERYRKAKVE